MAFRRPCLVADLLRPSPGALHECLHLLRGKPTVFVVIHSFEDTFVSCLELWQRDGSVTISVHQTKDHAHHDRRTYRAATHHTPAHLSHHAPTHHPSLPHHPRTPSSPLVRSSPPVGSTVAGGADLPGVPVRPPL